MIKADVATEYALHDADKDGFLNKAEFKAAVKSFRGRKGSDKRKKQLINEVCQLYIVQLASEEYLKWDDRQ